MKNKIIIRLLLLVAVSIFLYSCVHDEMASSTDASSKEYTNKSLWKQDEKYIKNVMKVYYEHEAEIKKISGTPYWDYASTMETYDESFLMVPIVDHGKVVSIIQVPRDGATIYFYYTNFRNQIDFFQKLVFSEYKKALPAETTSPTEKLTVCNRQSIAVWMPNDESNSDPSSGAGHWETFSVIKCVQLADNCVGVVNANGVCETGGGGYPYPGGDGPQDPQEPEDPCAKLKTQNASPNFKAKVTAIDKPEVFAYDHEMGYASAYPVNTTATGTQYQPMENTLGSHAVSLPDGDQYFGFMHTHNNESNGGGYPVKIFSPADLATFLTSCVANAETHGNISDAYAMVITSEGNYIIQYTGSSSGFGIGPNTIKFWKTWYDRETKLIQNEDGTIDQDKVENMFLRFLKEKVNIDGIELYKTEKITGSAEKLNLNSNNIVIPTPCPQN